MCNSFQVIGGLGGGEVKVEGMEGEKGKVGAAGKGIEDVGRKYQGGCLMMTVVTRRKC